MQVGRARKTGCDLVRQLAGKPERTGAVEKLLQLGADVPEARRRERLADADLSQGLDAASVVSKELFTTKGTKNTEFLF